MAAFKRGRARIAAAIVTFGVLITCAHVLALQDDPHSRTETRAPARVGEIATVIRVVDGDTIVVQRTGTNDTDRVRLIGINTPELAHGTGADECFAAEATAILQAMLPEATKIELRRDPTQLQSDKYGRLLRHVDAEDTGTNIVLALLEAGAGPEYTYDKPYAGQPEYRAAEANAKTHATGYWGACQ
ncbi:thermonuclease family protein [Leucobacter aridicollis]|uniref:thermonuclease family protein n=1 Tax=Leucobacter aridicollis TaxID=283878 RepID=UPI002107E3D0|nr:thermonuclease family protein [Leucobacter aridicollis]UTX53283.1 thermonuclease family protein [Leucobacter aridicollis]